MTFQRQPGHRLEWAILVPTTAARLDQLVREIDAWFFEDEDDHAAQTWVIVEGSKGYSALCETEPGSSGTDTELAAALAKAVRAAVYSVGVSGYDDPDHGLPFIEVYEDDARRLLWMADPGDDELPPVTVSPGPPGVPCDDPFAFAEALGCSLEHLY